MAPLSVSTHIHKCVCSALQVYARREPVKCRLSEWARAALLSTSETLEGQGFGEQCKLVLAPGRVSYAMAASPIDDQCAERVRNADAGDENLVAISFG